MGVAVYPRLSELLRARRLTVAELERQIQMRFGLSVDPKTLYRLTHADPVQRADLEIVGAAAAVLGVGLDDLFEIQAVPLASANDASEMDLDPAQSRRLAELFDQQAQRALSDSERVELEGLVTEYGLRLHERRLAEIAAVRGVSIEEAQAQVATELDQALAWWEDVEADPRRRAAVAKRVRGHRKRTSA